MASDPSIPHLGAGDAGCLYAPRDNMTTDHRLRRCLVTRYSLEYRLDAPWANHSGD